MKIEMIRRTSFCTKSRKLLISLKNIFIKGVPGECGRKRTP